MKYYKRSLIIFISLIITVLICGCGKNKTEQVKEAEEPIIIVGDEPFNTEENSQKSISYEKEEMENAAIVQENEDMDVNVNLANSETKESGDDEEHNIEPETDSSNDDELEDEDSNLESNETLTEPSVEQTDWVCSLKASSATEQLLIVSAKGSACTVSFHEKNDNGIWEEIFVTNGKLGKNGVGKTKEGDGKTPKGIYHFTMAFGRKDNPGCNLNYVKVNDSHYWVDDINSAYYNKFVNINEVNKDWNSAEHLAGAGESYNYALATDYNSSCVKGAGSAIFVHCLPTGGAGCVAIPEDKIKILVSRVRQGCNIIIDSDSSIETY